LDVPVAFHYQADFDEQKIDWYSRFGILVTGAILPSDLNERLRQRGARLVSYEWSSAFYPDDPVSAPLSWQREVLQSKGAWLLNRAPISGGAAEGGRGAWWYDFADPALRSRRAAHLAGTLVRSGYDGFFFDTLGFEQLPPPVQASFRSRHKEQDYNRCQAAFLGELRKLVGNSKVLFLNQGYRQAELFLPHADYDLSESYFTLSQGNTTRFRPWHDPAAPWESVRTPMAKLIMPAAQRFPRVRFVHLNYAAGAQPLVRRAIQYSLCCARLWNHDAYLVAPAPSHEPDEIYFSDLGRPLTGSFVEDEHPGVAWRAFEKGIVAINSGPGPAFIRKHKLKLADPPQGLIVR
jgi:hypothetical protein